MAAGVLVLFVFLIVGLSSSDAIRSAANVTYLPFHNGVLDARNETSEKSVCIQYYPNITTFPTEQDNVLLPIADLSYWDGCVGNFIPDPALISGNFVIVSSGNCSVIQKAQVIETLGGKGVLVVIVVSQGVHLDDNKTYPQTIPIALIWPSNKDTLTSLGDSYRISIYSPVSSSHIDFSLLVIWAFAVLTVGIGAYWSGLVRHDLQQQNRILSQSERQGELSNDNKAAMQEEVSLSVTPTLVGVFVLCMCGMLLLLYFFFSYLVYVIIGLFVLASTTAVYQCLEPIVQRIPIGNCKLPSCNLSFLRIHAEIRQIVLFIGAISLGACWVVYRKESFAWILQDILGFAFSVNMIRQVRLPSLKICTLLLVLLFFYDIFFVFVTPLFTKNGESVMVEVATGGNSGGSSGNSISGGGGGGGGSSSSADEQLPMVVRVPHLGSDPLLVCNLQSYSLLGFGDILVPGMLVGFCHGFDLATNNRRKLYFIITLIAYGLGLLVTFAGLYLMAIAQPALLYLVPFTLIPVFVLGLVRHELNILWNGDGQPFESTRLTGESRLEDGGSCQYDNSDQEQGSPGEAQQAKNSTKDRDSLMT